MFSQLTGSNWYADARTLTDSEYKVTEFDYENYIASSLIPKNAANQPEFKRLVRILNIFSQTEHERLQDSKESFKDLMPVFRNLNTTEQEALLHKIRNTGRVLGDSFTGDLLTEMTYQTIE